jgi:hypothetical protein
MSARIALGLDMVLIVRRLAGIAIAWGLVSCGVAGCENTVLSDIQSPDGQHHVVVFGRSCGATTDFSTQVSIEARSSLASGAGNVFIADTDHGNSPAGPGGGPDVTARWVDASTVEISYNARVRVFHKAARQGGIEVRFVAGP